MSCAEYERTSAYLDGELDAQAGAEAERHIAGCADCQAFVTAAAEASEALRAPSARLSAPPALRARIARSLDAEARALARPNRRFWQGAFSGAGASALAAGLAFAILAPPAPQTLTGAFADAHVDALMAGRTIQVVSSNHHTVKPWFAGRAPLSPPVADFAAQGFVLTGGRVQTVAGAKAAVVVYRHGAHEIDLFVWADRGGALPAAAERRGYRLAFWKRGDLDFAAVSDVQASAFEDFVRLVRESPE